MIETKFKQTEIGWITEEWEVELLGNLSSDCSYGVSAEAISYDGHHKYIRITDIDDTNGCYCSDSPVSPMFFTRKHIVKINDLLIARTGASVGKTYLYNKKDGLLVYAGFLMKLNISEANSQFIFYQTKSNTYLSWIISESNRTGQPGINLQQIKKYPLPLPPLPEQHRIATALSDVDALIVSLDKLIAKKQAIKQGAMQQLLT